MQLHFSPSMSSITISSSNGLFDLMRIKIAAPHISYRTLFHAILIVTFLLPFFFILTAVVTLEGVKNCSSFDCLGRRLGPKFLGKADDSMRLVTDLHKILDQVNTEEIPAGLELPESFSEFVSEMKTNQYDAKTFAVKLKAMARYLQIEKLEEEVRELKLAELKYKHFAATIIPKGIHCLSLRLTNEYSSNAHARKQLPPPELLTLLSDNSYFHFVLASDNILAASVVVTSTVRSSSKPEKVVFHVITDKKTYAGMHSWFALNPISPAIIEVKSVHQFDWLARENVVFEVIGKRHIMRYYNHGSHTTGANRGEISRSFASKLQPRSPKYILLLDHIRMYLPEFFPNLDKVVLLADDVVIQRDLSPLWEINLGGKNLNSNMTMWKLGTLPPALITFRGHIHPIDPSWHILSLGYQNNTDLERLQQAAVIHYNGYSKPWIEIGFNHLRPFWTKYINSSNNFIRNCHIMEP
ncbi:probable galacturonosyltransferase 14 isoform X3 [Magnolia sinica]|uniref:probable galacturonosyltransferase 14 isoform X3 n=1 Tax=Magnolia sinica TaxID=86752 RepID=UPI002658C0D3|nr:probable galacturonosyltransferase 14 isoform X3 [Magnolia sinica]